MGSVDCLLASEERVLFRTRLHPVVYAGAASFSGFVALVVTLLIRHNDLAAATDVRIAVVGTVLAAASLVPTALRRWRSAFLVTDRRVLISGGLLVARTLEGPLTDLEVATGRWGRLLGYGTVVIVGSDGSVTTLARVARSAEMVEAARAQARRPVSGRRSEKRG